MLETKCVWTRGIAVYWWFALKQQERMSGGVEYPVSQPVGILFSALFRLNWIVGFVELQALVESAEDLTPLLSRILWNVYE